HGGWRPRGIRAVVVAQRRQRVERRIGRPSAAVRSGEGTRRARPRGDVLCVAAFEHRQTDFVGHAATRRRGRTRYQHAADRDHLFGPHQRPRRRGAAEGIARRCAAGRRQRRRVQGLTPMAQGRISPAEALRIMMTRMAAPRGAQRLTEAMHDWKCRIWRDGELVPREEVGHLSVLESYHGEAGQYDPGIGDDRWDAIRREYEFDADEVMELLQKAEAVQTA